MTKFFLQLHFVILARRANSLARVPSSRANAQKCAPNLSRIIHSHSIPFAPFFNAAKVRFDHRQHQDTHAFDDSRRSSVVTSFVSHEVVVRIPRGGSFGSELGLYWNLLFQQNLVLTLSRNHPKILATVFVDESWISAPPAWLTCISNSLTKSS